jgi:UrcA family protein
MYRFKTSIMIFALVLGYQLANAAPYEDVPSVIVHFADLDLTRGEGLAVLYRRLKGAAETVCAAHNGRDLGSKTRYKTCLESAVAKAVTKVDQPALTAIYRAQFKDHNTAIQVAQK